MMLANILRRFPKALSFAKYFFLKPAPSYKVWPAISLNPFFKSLTISTFSSHHRPVVSRVFTMLNASARLRKLNYFIRTNSEIASTVSYRYHVAARNRAFSTSKSMHSRCLKFPKNMSMSFLKPEKFLASGCCGAVWSAKCTHLVDSTRDDVHSPSQSSSNDLAVKVLYNFHASKSPEECEPYSSFHNHGEGYTSLPKQWHLVKKQVERECNFRPSSDHPNIVPILNTFYDVAPPSKKDSNCSPSQSADVSWQNVENFPEGFGGEPVTCYLVMPRFDATLEDLSNGKWKPFMSSPNSYLDSPAFLQPQAILPIQGNPRYAVPTEDAVALLSQIFEAVAELEVSGISHRDIKPTNILVRVRESKSDLNIDLLNASETELANSRLHAAVTDFGCAIRTGGKFLRHILSADSEVSHSGNTALWPPEVACYFKNQQSKNIPSVIPLDYSRADIWAAATHTYLLFGQENPFISGLLSPLDYDDQNLPPLPSSAPSILDWVLQMCLRRDPKERPPASLVADVLHVWCILQHFKRGVLNVLDRKIVNFLQMCDIYNVTDKFLKSFSNPSEHVGNNKLLTVAEHVSTKLNFGKKSNHFLRQLHQLLQLAWAYDWLLGPAQAPMGLRCKFYSRITPERFSTCLRILNLCFLSKINMEPHVKISDILKNVDIMI